MGRLTIEQAIEYWKIFLDEIEELRATPGTDPEEWDEQEKATVAALEALVKQRHYEDLEEQGRLIELPCALYDVVWSIQPFKVVRSDSIGSFGYSEDGLEMWDWNGKWIGIFGKTAFLTKEEAEAKLKELSE